jgi:chaperonin GroES
MDFFALPVSPGMKKWLFYACGIVFRVPLRPHLHELKPTAGMASGDFSLPQKVRNNRLNIKKHKINTTMAKKVNVTPLHDRVIVKAAAAEEKTAGGIIIPDTAKEKPQRGTVIAAGPGKKDEPVTVKTGDTVLYGKYAGTEIQIEGEDYLIMRESDILAIV